MSQEQKTNPANAVGTERERIPMSVPQLKLSVPEIPGYHLHWMLGTPSRINQALQAGYTFVEDDEVNVTNSSLADNASRTGNTDMGSRVSVSAGTDLGLDGTEQRLILMKIKLEYWEADQAALEERNEQIAAALRGGQDAPGSNNPHGGEHRYIPEGHRRTVETIFTPKRRRT